MNLTCDFLNIKIYHITSGCGNVTKGIGTDVHFGALFDLSNELIIPKLQFF